MNAARREDCRKISVLTTEGTGPGDMGQRAQDEWWGERLRRSPRGKKEPSYTAGGNVD
jgi:hypothetical protein